MTAKDILHELSPLGRASYKKVLIQNYGVREPCYGVPISELKKIQKRIRHDYQLALDLYETGNYDAMYLAGLVADASRMTPQDLQRWADQAYAASLPSTTVAGVAAESPHGPALARRWIESTKPMVAVAGWAAWSCLVSIKKDEDLDLAELKTLLDRVRQSIHSAPDVVRYQMNAFLIAVGSYVVPLTELALRLGERIGPVTADLGDNDCQVPLATDYIRKVQKLGRIGKKRRRAIC